MLQKLKRKAGQSTLEYLILITAVIAIIIALVYNPNSPFRNTMQKTINTGVQQLNSTGSTWSKNIGD